MTARAQTPVKLTYWPITRNIARCRIPVKATVTIRPDLHGCAARWNCNEWNMSATVARTSEIRIGGAIAIIQWQDGGLVKTGGDLSIEIVKQKTRDE